MKKLFLFLFLASLSNTIFAFSPEGEEAKKFDKRCYVAVYVWPSSGVGALGHGALTLVENDRPILHIDLYADLEEPLGDNSSIRSGNIGLTGYFTPTFKEMPHTMTNSVLRLKRLGFTP